MSLPWFSFYPDAYLGNTMHLTTEEHGAYLLLMLAYYRTEKPLPGYDRALASIAKLPLDRWLIVRVGLEPFFVTDGDVWRHERIEAEIVERTEKHAKSSEKARNAALAKAAKHNSERAPSKLEAPPKPARAKREPSSSPTHLHLQEHTTLTSSSSTRENDDNPKAVEDSGTRPDVAAGTRRYAQSEMGQGKAKPLPTAVEPAASPSVPNLLGTQLPETWVPSPTDQIVAKGFGMTDSDISHELIGFHGYNAGRGTFSRNWSGTWTKWCKEWKDRQSKRAPPRIDVTTSPSTKDWEYGAAAWVRSQSLWPRSLGPDPLSGRCRCPPEILRAHGIDPANGGALKVEGAA